MSSAKTQLKYDTHVLSHGARCSWGVRVKTVPSGGLELRAASTTVKEARKKMLTKYSTNYLKANTPLAQDLYNEDVDNMGLFLCSGLGRCVTGSEFE